MSAQAAQPRESFINAPHVSFGGGRHQRRAKSELLFLLISFVGFFLVEGLLFNSFIDLTAAEDRGPSTTGKTDESDRARSLGSTMDGYKSNSSNPAFAIKARSPRVHCMTRRMNPFPHFPTISLPSSSLGPLTILKRKRFLFSFLMG